MKPFLGIDLTTDKKNEKFDGLEFLVMEPSEALTKSFEDSQGNAEETVKKASMPPVLRVLQIISFVFVIIFVRVLARSDVSFAEGYQNAPWVYWVGCISAIVSAALWFWGKKRTENVLSTDESAQTFSRLEGVAASIYAELGVPAYAKNVDVLSFFYKNDNGEIKLKEKPMQMFKYINFEYKIFSDSENFYLVNCDGKFSFPLRDIVSVKKVKKHITFSSWNKEEKYNKGIYKEYKITEDKYGTMHGKGYVLIEVKHNGESFGIYLPDYELPVIEEITRIKAQEE